MRGRTNITQRTGPSVIGNLVTQKQVTGDKIEVGDFVEFTGDTNVMSKVAGDFSFQHCNFCKISENVIVYSFWSFSKQFKFVVFQNGLRLKEFNFSGFDTSDSVYSENVDGRSIYKVIYNNGKLYVGLGDYATNPATYFPENPTKEYLFIFNIDSNYNISYSSAVKFPNIYNNIRALYSPSATTNYVTIYAPIMKNNYVYIPFYYYSNVAYVVGVLIYDLSGNYVNGYYKITSSTANQLSVNDTKDNIFVRFGSYAATTNIGGMITINCNTNNITYTSGFQIVSNGINYGNYIAEDEESGIFFLGYRVSQSNNDLIYVTAFYLIDDVPTMIYRHSISLNYHYDNYSCPIYLYLEKILNSKINVYVIVDNSRPYQTSTARIVRVDLLQYENSNITLLDAKIFNVDTDVTSAIYDIKSCAKYNDSFYILASKYFKTNSTVTNFVKKFVFTKSNDKIVIASSLDLVKKYSSRIDGVAKTEGSEGQQISVYIP